MDVRAFLILALGAGCSTTFEPTTCATDSDCDSGFVCENRETKLICVTAEDAPIVVGQSAPISGAAQALGTGMKLGIELAFDEQNAKGGIRGRQLVLNFRDDSYDPIQAEANARVLVDAQVINGMQPRCPNTATPVSNGAVPPVLVPVSMSKIDRGPNAVIALLGSVGTPTMVRAAPVAIESNTLYFGAYTGAGTLLRDTTAGPCANLIFNVRASYGQEGQATLELFINRSVLTNADGYKNLMSFDQNDTFGQAGYNGIVDAFKNTYTAFPAGADPTNPIARFRYLRSDHNSVPAAAVLAEAYLATLLMQQTGTVRVGIMMTDTYGAAAQFIQHLREWQFANDAQQTSLMKATRLVLYFSNVSFVGPDALAEELVFRGSVNTPNGPMPFTQDVTVSQVVPNWKVDQSDIVKQYMALMQAAGSTPSFTSLEGYLSTRVFIGGLLAHEGPFIPELLVPTFEALPDLNLGIGASAGFNPMKHQYSNSIWGTSIQADGTFRNLYFWTAGSPIQFFQ